MSFVIADDFAVCAKESLLTATSAFLPDILSCPTKSEGGSLKIGFLGLGNMGSLLVSRLLKSGHDLTVWNRTPSKVLKSDLLT